MIYLRFRDKVARVVDCPRCEGRGYQSLRTDSLILVDRQGNRRPFLTGHTWLCSCRAGKLVTYPWTRGKSLTPLVPRKHL